ncbi:hypothetical protein [Algoriphagus sp.]|uniref:hypothetical protein n=1 Tax=Algoriphagus sp. TaxID=1872435 RepID=UPI00391BC29E
MKKLLILVCILTSHSTFGQITNLNMNGVPARITPYTGVEGSPYLFEDWSRANIGLTNAGIKENVAYKFNIYDNELEVINEAGNTIYLTKEYVEFVELERPSLILANAQQQGLLPRLMFKKGFEIVNGIGPNDLVNVLAEGKKYTLIRRFYSDLVTPPKNSYAPTAGRMFVFEESFYLIDERENVTNVRNRANVILKAINPADQDKAKQIIKDGKLDLGREDHLVRFFTELNKS